MCEYTCPGFLQIAGRHDCPAPWTLAKASHKGDMWLQKGLWVVSVYFTEQKRDNSMCYCVLLIMDVTEHLRAPQIASRAKQSWEFCCSLPQDECHVLCISNVCYGCISLYMTRRTDHWFFIHLEKLFPVIITLHTWLYNPL